MPSDTIAERVRERKDHEDLHRQAQRQLKMRQRRAYIAVAAVMVIVLVVVAAAVLPRVFEHRASARYPVTATALSQARTALGALEVSKASGGGSSAGRDYSRDAFGPSWADVDHNGCDTRNDILARDLANVTYKTDTHNCVVMSGILHDPYTDTIIDFERGKRSAEVQIDHVVALANAWKSGADAWTSQTREQFANDPENLLAVDGPANQKKSASDAAAWLPNNVGYRCIYAIRQVTVKNKYRLTVTASEKKALEGALDHCVVAQ